MKLNYENINWAKNLLATCFWALFPPNKFSKCSSDATISYFIQMEEDWEKRIM